MYGNCKAIEVHGYMCIFIDAVTSIAHGPPKTGNFLYIHIFRSPHRHPPSHYISTSDISAAESVGSVLADRCLKYGILRSTIHESEYSSISDKVESLVITEQVYTYVCVYVPSIFSPTQLSIHLLLCNKCSLL